MNCANDEPGRTADLGSSFLFSRSAAVRKWVWRTLIALSVIAIGFVPYQKIIWDGGIDIEIRIQSATNAKLKAMDYEFQGHPPIDNDSVEALRQADYQGELRSYDLPLPADSDQCRDFRTLR